MSLRNSRIRMGSEKFRFLSKVKDSEISKEEFFESSK